jgi:site-specific DNA-methyltransferase (adenine-specific)
MYEIYNDDCLTKMKELQDESVQLILTDPPYASTECGWDRLPNLDLLFQEWKRILTKNGSIVMTMAFPAGIKFLNAGIDIFRYDAVWCKNNKTNFVNAKNKLMRQHENIFVFSKGTTANGSQNKMIYNPQGLIEVNQQKVCKLVNSRFGIRNNYFNNEYVQKYTNYPSTLINIAQRKNKTKHNTEKPVELFEYLLKTYSNENDVILDPFAGSGTTGVACMMNNRDCILIEKDEKYFEIIKKRLKNN